MPCPGSVNLIASLPVEMQDTPNEHSLRGTAAHEVLLIHCLRDGKALSDYLGYPVAGSNTSARLLQEDLSAIQVALTYIRGRITEIQNAMLDVKLFVEHPVYPGKRFHACPTAPEAWPFGKPPEGDGAPFVMEREDCTGSADVILIGGGVLETMDYKHGVRYVDEVENTQMLLYSLGALREVLKMGDAQVIRNTIIQPRCFRDDVDDVRSWDLGDAELVRWAVRFNNAALLTDETVNPVFNPGKPQCDYCPAKGVCPALTDKVEDLASALSKGPPGLPPGLGDPVSPSVSPATAALVHAAGVIEGLLQPVEQLSDEKLAAIMESESLVRAWIDAVKAHCTQRAKDGSPVWGKLVAGRGAKKYTLDEDQLIKKLTNMSRAGSKAKLKRAEFTDTKLISPAQMEKRIKPLVSEVTWKNLKGLIAVIPGGPTLVPLSDPRKPIQPSAEEMFPTQTPETVETVSQEDFLS